MQWAAIIGLFLVSTIKFLFAPFGGPKLELTFWETYIACGLGAVVSSAFFYFSANFFMKRAHAKRLMLYRKSLEENIPVKQKKTFTRINKLVVRIKRSLGIYGTSFWVPLFLSIPIGSIITAKFYGKEKRTFPLIVLGIGINGFVTTGLAYLFFS